MGTQASRLATATPPTRQDDTDAIDFKATPVLLTAAQQDFEVIGEGGAIIFVDSKVEAAAIGVAFHRQEANPIQLKPGDALIFRKQFRRVFFTWPAQAGVVGQTAIVIFPLGALEQAATL